MIRLYKKYKIFVVGIILIYTGIFYINNPVFRFKKHDIMIDFGNLKWIVGGLLISLGIYSLICWFKNRNEIYIEYSICTKCKETYIYSKLNDGICPKCNIKTIDMEEYYK